MTIIGKLIVILDQYNEILRRVASGSLDADQVSKELQDIIEGKFAVPPTTATSSSWYVSPKAQLERVKLLNAERGWGFSEADFPSIPEFSPRSDSEVLLLAVYLPDQGSQKGLHRTFDELWELIQVPNNYDKVRVNVPDATAGLLRRIPWCNHRHGIRWVAFDPNTYHGDSPKAVEANGFGLAGVEVLMAAVIFPDWISSWNGDSSPYPWIGGLQFNYPRDPDWLLVPCLNRSEGEFLEVELNAGAVGCALDGWSLPTVREC